MKIIEISHDKLEDMSEAAENMLRYGGKLMQCIDELQRESGSQMGERGGYRDYRDGMGERGGYREYIGERRGVPGSGRGYRY